MRRECNRATGKSYRLNFWPVELWSRTGSKVAAKSLGRQSNKILTRKLSLTKYLLSLQIVQILNWRPLEKVGKTFREFISLLPGCLKYKFRGATQKYHCRYSYQQSLPPSPVTLTAALHWTNKFSYFLQTFYILKVTSKIDPPALSEGVFFPKVTCFPKEPI